jgi:hypothetical protein
MRTRVRGGPTVSGVSIANMGLSEAAQRASAKSAGRDT